MPRSIGGCPDSPSALAGGLQIRPGDRVAYLGYNSPVVLELLFACARLGAVLVPLNWRLTASEHRFVLGDAEPSALFAEPDFYARAEEVRGGVPHLVACGPPAARDGWHRYEDLTAAAEAPLGESGDFASPLLVVYTSGTTGRPKGAVLTQGALLWNALNSIAAHDMTSADHVLTVLPMFHVGGLNIQTTPAILAGATITLARRFDPDETLDLLGDAPAHAVPRRPRRRPGAQPASPLRRRRSLEPARHVHRVVHRPRGGDPPVDGPRHPRHPGLRNDRERPDRHRAIDRGRRAQGRLLRQAGRPLARRASSTPRAATWPKASQARSGSAAPI